MKQNGNRRPLNENDILRAIIASNKETIESLKRSITKSESVINSLQSDLKSSNNQVCQLKRKIEQLSKSKNTASSRSPHATADDVCQMVSWMNKNPLMGEA